MELNGNEHLLTPTIVRGFSLIDKAWLWGTISLSQRSSTLRKSEVFWNTDTFTNLGLPDDKKFIIWNLASQRSQWSSIALVSEKLPPNTPSIWCMSLVAAWNDVFLEQRSLPDFKLPFCDLYFPDYKSLSLTILLSSLCYGILHSLPDHELCESVRLMNIALHFSPLSLCFLIPMSKYGTHLRIISAHGPTCLYLYAIMSIQSTWDLKLDHYNECESPTISSSSQSSRGLLTPNP